MLELTVTSLIWALSFGLIRHQLASVDPDFVALARLLLSLLVFLPLVRPRGLGWRRAGALAAVGAVQFGFMYVTYQEAFQFLAAYQIALFTVFTPIWVTLLDDLLARRLHLRSLLAAAVAVFGTGVVVYRGVGDHVLLRGFLLVQLSNLCFAAGQIAYARLMAEPERRPDRQVFGLLYAGAVVAAGVGFAVRGGHVPSLSARQGLVLVYLGLVASGVGFFLWNKGARRVNAGALAVMNNLKVPLGVACSLLVFGERVDLLRVAAGGVLVGLALWVNGGSAPRREAEPVRGAPLAAPE